MSTDKTTNTNQPTIAERMVITERAKAIARAGAKKMTAQGYTREFLYADLWTVTSPAGDRYTVSEDASMDDFSPCCDCPFCSGTETSGANNYCKHAQWLRDELKAEAEELDRRAAELAEREEYGKPDHEAGKF